MPGRHPLADLHRQLLEHAGDAGPHLERLDLAPPQLVEGAHLVDPGALGRELGLGGPPALLEALPLDAGLLGELVRLEARALQVELGDQPVLGQLLVRLVLQPGRLRRSPTRPR